MGQPNPSRETGLSGANGDKKTDDEQDSQPRPVDPYYSAESADYDHTYIIHTPEYIIHTHNTYMYIQ